ncbi:hypothetical protein K504DRAFT_394103 [Pleomassaria siparia CBS 279.74]|uniref:Rhodopsin domain-containing protein n=1 Tax=Pleomassaria siparia CBS 279.74 TaxID=1314801 RepID=A0A6G1JQY2_9PLEO|nr:hypothetical protein K504DRAFT_394103 [Pleomassaria siparia CBS 279.74]
MVKGFGLDDRLMVVTLFFYTAYLASQLGGALHGTGQKRANISDEDAQTALRYWWFCEVFYTLGTSILKIAVGFFLLRITVVRVHIWIIRTIMIVAAFLGVAYSLLVIFQCRPISFWWDLNPAHTGKCLNPTLVTNMTYVVSALNSFADWTFGILPIFIVKDLQMKTRVKVVVAGVIALAAIGSTATIIRLPYTSTLEGYKGEFLYRTTDFAIWTTVEVGVGITAGCIATLKPLMASTASSMGYSNTPTAQSRTSRMPWPSHGGTNSKLGVAMNGQQLDDLSRGTDTGKSASTTVMVTGGRLSGESDEETFLGTGQRGGSKKKKKVIITREVTTTITTEERTTMNRSQSAKGAMGMAKDKMDGPSRKMSVRSGSGSLSGKSQATLDEELRARVHERF